jgi:sporulation integral membrane protein YtvI
MTTERKLRFIINTGFIGVLLALAYLVFKYLLGWLLPFLIAWVIASLLQRPINWILKHSRLRRKTISSVVTFALVALVVGILSFLLCRAVMELTSFVIALPSWFAKTAPSIIESVRIRFDGFLTNMPTEWEAQIRTFTNHALSYIQTELVGVSSFMVNLVTGTAMVVPSVLMAFVITLISTFFMSAEYTKIKCFLLRQLPERYAALTSGASKTVRHTVGRLVQSYLLIMLITFIELSIGFAVLHVDHPLFVAALTSLVDILPVLGTGTVLVPWAAIALLTGDVGLGVGILLLYGIVSIIRNILEPRIVGKRLGIHPLATLVFMYLGLRVLGVLGMFLFPLAFILLKHIQDSGAIHLWND